MSKTSTTTYSVGDRVQVKPGKSHDDMTKDKKGTIVEIKTPALGIKFDGMNMVHKWYTDDDVKEADSSTDEEMNAKFEAKEIQTTHRAYTLLEAKQFNDDQRVITGIATSISMDRMGDIVDPSGIQVAKDIPLFMHHDSRLVVGRARFGGVTKSGIPFEARLPFVTEAGTLKDRVDEAWQTVKYGLISAVSIGFRVLDDGYEIIKGGGLKFLKTEVLELSLVPVPAQPEAVIQGFKSMDDRAQRAALIQQVKAADHIERAASGRSHGGGVLLVSRNPGASGAAIAAVSRGAVLLKPRKPVA